MLLKRGIISIVSILLFTLGVLQFPHLFISKKFDYKSFQIYSNDSIELNGAVKNSLDSVVINLKESSFYKQDEIFQLYFVKGSFYEKLIGFFGLNNIASSKFDKHIYIGKPDFETSILRKEDNDFEWVNLVQIITHEAVHSQMYEDYSSVGIMKTPSWINEGYAEYISYRMMRDRANYDLEKLWKNYEKTNGIWAKTAYQSMTPKQYLRDRILMEYLIDVKQMHIKEIIKDASLDPEKIMAEIKITYKTK